VFNRIQFLEDRGVPYLTSGTDISKDWLGIKCPFCDDPLNHCGISPNGMAFTCWKCKESGSIIKLITEVDSIPWYQAKEVFAKYSDRVIEPYIKIEPTGRTQVIWPPYTVRTLLPAQRIWLESKGFDIDTYKKYQLRCTDIIGKWKFRIVIPIIMSHRIVSYTTRVINDAMSPRYKTCPNEDTVLPIKNTLYNIDSAIDEVVVMEGPTDVWNFGDGAVATLGVNYTPTQVYLLSQFRRVFILFDADDNAQKLANRLAHELAPIVSETHILTLDEGDPGELSKDDVKSLRREIFGKV